MPALVGGQEAPWMPAGVTDADSVVLLVLDGLGWSAIEEHRASLPTLAAMDGGPITTVVPSTTATALTSIATGLAPAQHGIRGFIHRQQQRFSNGLEWFVAHLYAPVLRHALAYRYFTMAWCLATLMAA
jgi:predicted AlkP superfamily pyrophosphatase or phosphodiesterase